MAAIVHITPHLGGGVGRVLLNYLEKVRGNPDFAHKVLCLEYANDKAVSASQTSGFSLRGEMSADPEGILAEIAGADIVLIHWWNHPCCMTFWFVKTCPLPVLFSGAILLVSMRPMFLRILRFIIRICLFLHRP